MPYYGNRSSLQLSETLLQNLSLSPTDPVHTEIYKRILKEFIFHNTDTSGVYLSRGTASVNGLNINHLSPCYLLEHPNNSRSRVLLGMYFFPFLFIQSRNIAV